MTRDGGCIEVWTTIAVTPLPAGWRNVYANDNGWRSNACPALLLQELREIGRTHNGHTFDEPQDTPYDTRVVFGDHEPGSMEVQPADGANYLGTVGPGDQPEHLADGYGAKPTAVAS